MIRFINFFFNRLGIQIKRSQSLASEQAYYQGIINGAKALYKIKEEYTQRSLNNKLAGLAFSKDRPLQLHALLNSYFKLVANAAPVDIIYKASSSRIKAFYKELAVEFSGYPIELIEEMDFYKQVIDWLENKDADRIFFLTDDAVFLEEMDMQDAVSFNPLSEIFTVRHGKDLDYSFAFNQTQELPVFETVINKTGTSFCKWEWTFNQESPDWNYPLSVDGNVYLRKEMLLICKQIKFRTPNSLEANMQVFRDFFSLRKGICYTKVKMINVPCNVVQTEFANRFTGTFTVEELLAVWQQNRRIVIDDFYKLCAYDAVNKCYTFA